VFLVRGLSRFHRASDVADVVVHHARDGSGRLVPIKVSDLAKVVLEDREIDHLVRVDGTEGVGLWVYKEAGTNTVAVSRTVRQALDSLGADLPGIEARLVSDEAALVEDAIADVEKAALIGIILAIAVLALFLRSPGPTVVVAVAVPVSLFATLFAMHLGDRTLNLMTLGGLALGAGMLVDNAIVVVESIFRRRAAGDDPATAAAKGTAAVAGAIVASTLTTCIVFLPVLFVRGLAARLVSGISFTVVTSLLVSLAVAVFLIPALASWLLPRGKAHAVDPGSSRIENFVAGLLKAPAIVVLVSIVLVAGAAFMLQRLGTELLPPADPRQFALRLVGPPGQRVEATAEAVSRVEEILLLAAGDDLRATLSEVGRLPEDDRLIREEQTEENTARILVRLAAADESQSPAEADPGAEGIDLSGQGVTTAVTRALGPPSGKSASQVVGAAAPAVADLAGLDVSWEVGTSALSRALGTTGPPIVVEIAGRSLVDLRIAASSLRAALDQEPALWNVRSSFEGGPPELRVVLDRPMADGLGVDLDAVAEVLQAALDGLTVTVMSTGDEERDVTLHLPAVRRNDLLGLPFTTADGRRLAIGDVAHFEPAAGAREIYRRDQR
ncbi:MAG: efflux RND transporter permease subunit, partial [bacterium]|nr:efflux RND transporter permease subunit [bacterium]